MYARPQNKRKHAVQARDRVPTDLREVYEDCTPMRAEVLDLHEPDTEKTSSAPAGMLVHTTRMVSSYTLPLFVKF